MMGTKDRLLGLSLGVRQDFEKMSVFPLRVSGNGGPEYVTLKEAMEKGVFVVSEVGEAGTVPELAVENKGDVAVLILDGEELAGAKQNRILNTTVLVGPKSRTKIPVSCTEQGRWRSVSAHFHDSGHHMSPGLREINMMNVSASLRMGGAFSSDQGAVWDEVARQSVAAKVRSATGAMRDVFEAKRKALDDYLKSFRFEAGQLGLLVFIDGQAAGLDYVSREQSFGVLFPKLIKSYAMEAMLAGEKGEPEGPGPYGGERGGYRGGIIICEDKNADIKRPKKKKAKARGQAPDEQAARDFLSRAAACGETPYPSVGLGTSLRYEGKEVIGSALAVDGHVVHMAFFRTAGNQVRNDERMASTNARRQFRLF